VNALPGIAVRLVEVLAVVEVAEVVAAVQEEVGHSDCYTLSHVTETLCSKPK
jgi:hypothetical protein